MCLEAEGGGGRNNFISLLFFFVGYPDPCLAQSEHPDQTYFNPEYGRLVPQGTLTSHRILFKTRKTIFILKSSQS